MNKLRTGFLLISIFTLSSCSSLGWLKFWDGEDEEEGPNQLYNISENRELERNWSVSNGNDISYGRLIPVVYDGIVFFINSIDFSSRSRFR